MSELWQPWENLFLHEVGRTMPVQVIAEKLESSESAVARQASRIGAPLISRMTGKPWRGVVDVVSGGFPCQDISSAGRGAGIDGDKSGLWREMAFCA